MTRITATEVTEQDKAAMILKERHEELELQQQKLKVFVANVEEICRSEEILRAKTEVHNTQNQKLITLLQYLRYGETPDSASFEFLKDSILSDTYAKADTAVDPRAILSIITNQYESMGIKICVDGNLPNEKDCALVFVQILQEAAANSVKHGYASELRVRITGNGSKYVMRVTDNGTRPVTYITEGVGITGMRRHAESVGGALGISTDPCFAVTAEIPVLCPEGEM